MLTASQRIFDAIGAQLILHRNFADTAPRVGDEYEIVEIIGAGGFGLICRATQLALRRSVALKLFPLGEGDTSGVREALREARSLARLEHPGIVTVYAAGESELIAGERLACAYVEMQLIDGTNLRDWLDAGERDAGEVLSLLCAAGRALAHAHAAGILHRDFKPENLMIDRSGGIKVIDFGLALVAEAGSATLASWDTSADAIGTRATSAGVVRGTRGYMAPEASGGQPRAASDQFALGVVIREALTGRHPFASETEPSGPVPRGGPELFARIKPLVDRAMASALADRFASVDELCDALEALPIGRSARGSWWPKLAIAGALLGLGGGITAVTLSLSDADPKSPVDAADQYRCSNEHADARPFVVDWDATDLSTFAATASSDLVFVRYDDCEIELLQGCSDASVPGRYGAYHSPFFSSGVVESFEMRSQDELNAKLPLGAASFADRLGGGELLELRYFVSATVNSTRNHVERAALRDNPRCEGATHFVASYNIGAFQLLARAPNESPVDLKRGGDLDSCLSHGQQRCRVPIRLVLQPIDEVAPKPEASAVPAAVPEPPPGGETVEEQAETLRDAAVDKRNAGDGPGCLEDLDRADALYIDEEDRPNILGLRAHCTMLAGDCQGGVDLLHEAVALHDTDKSANEHQILAFVTQAEHKYCPLEQLSGSSRGWAMFERTRDTNDPEVCKRMGEAALAMIKEQREANEEPETYAMDTLDAVSECLWRSDDCDAAKAWYIESKLQWYHGKPEAELREQAENTWKKRSGETGCSN